MSDEMTMAAHARMLDAEDRADRTDELLVRCQAERDKLRDLAELAVHAWLPLAPVQGSWGSGYRLTDRIDPTLRATVEEWANAGHALGELHAAVARLGEPGRDLTSDGDEPHGRP